MFPLELITMGAGFIASAFTTLFKCSMDNKQRILEMAVSKAETQAKIYEGARSQGNKGFHITRRIIALAVVGTVLFSTMLAPIFFPEVSIHVGIPEHVNGFWFFTDSYEAIKWFDFPHGIVMTPAISHMLYAITGLFFGNQVAK